MNNQLMPVQPGWRLFYVNVDENARSADDLTGPEYSLIAWIVGGEDEEIAMYLDQDENLSGMNSNPVATLCVEDLYKRGCHYGGYLIVAPHEDADKRLAWVRENSWATSQGLKKTAEKRQHDSMVKKLAKEMLTACPEIPHEEIVKEFNISNPGALTAWVEKGMPTE
jgi:hypothetical protein